MTPIRTFLTRSREILAVATKRPWQAHKHGHGFYDGPYADTPEGEFVCETATDDRGLGFKDAQAIVHAVNNFETLLAVIEVQAEALEFYSIESNHNSTWQTRNCGCCSDEVESLVGQDRGEKARQAMAEVREILGE
jgi:hypothetical protein